MSNRHPVTIFAVVQHNNTDTSDLLKAFMSKAEAETFKRSQRTSVGYWLQIQPLTLEAPSCD